MRLNAFCNSKLKISISRKTLWPGAYYEIGDISIIEINPKRHKSFDGFIDTMIHEYIHFLQNTKYYLKIMEMTGYENHPMEQTSNMIAKLLREKCRKEVFNDR